MESQLGDTRPGHTSETDAGSLELLNTCRIHGYLRKAGSEEPRAGAWILRLR